MTVTTATRAEYVGHALEDVIRRKVRTRHWYRQHRDLAWHDWERETDRELRLLFGVRREGIREYQAHQRRLRRMWHDALEDAAWRRAQLADSGDHFAGMAS